LLNSLLAHQLIPLIGLLYSAALHKFIVSEIFQKSDKLPISKEKA